MTAAVNPYADFDRFVDIWAFDRRLPAFMNQPGDEPEDYVKIEFFLAAMAAAPTFGVPTTTLRDETRLGLQHVLEREDVPATYAEAAQSVLDYMDPPPPASDTDLEELLQAGEIVFLPVASLRCPEDGDSAAPDVLGALLMVENAQRVLANHQAFRHGDDVTKTAVESVQWRLRDAENLLKKGSR